jgi:hypothetical protein
MPNSCVKKIYKCFGRGNGEKTKVFVGRIIIEQGSFKKEQFIDTTYQGG